MQKQNKYLNSTRQTEKQFVIVYSNENTRANHFQSSINHRVIVKVISIKYRGLNKVFLLDI